MQNSGKTLLSNVGRVRKPIIQTDRALANSVHCTLLFHVIFGVQYQLSQISEPISFVDYRLLRMCADRMTASSYGMDGTLSTLHPEASNKLQ